MRSTQATEANIYRTLIEKGLLSEYEFYYRERKAPELDEPTENLSDASTKVSLVESISDETRRLYSLEEAKIPKSACDQDLQNIDAGSNGNRRDLISDKGMHRYMSQVSSARKTQLHRITCIHCGVVYSKITRNMQGSGISLWDFDLRER